MGAAVRGVGGIGTHARVCACVCVCACACVRVCMRACVRACVRARYYVSACAGE